SMITPKVSGLRPTATAAATRVPGSSEMAEPYAMGSKEPGGTIRVSASWAPGGRMLETRIKFRLPTPATSKALSKALRGLGPSAPPATKVNLLGVGSTWTPPVLAAWSCLRRQVRTDAGMAARRHAEGSIAGRPAKSNKSCPPPQPPAKPGLPLSGPDGPAPSPPHHDTT